MKVYGVVLIGCGHIGEEHIQDIYYRDNVKIIAVVDRDITRAELFKRKYGALFCGTDYLDFIKLDSVDIVIIATYVSTHLSILGHCLQLNKHVLCEKPIAKTLADGRKFCELVENANSKVLVAHILRHNDTYGKVKELIDSGIIGKLTMMRMVQNHNTKEWERHKNLLADCSPIIDCGVHYIDIAQWFSNSEVEQVVGSGALLDADADCAYNHGIIAMRLKNGCHANYEAGWSRNLASSNIKEFIGEKGRITITLQWMRNENKEEGDLVQVFLTETQEYISVNIPSKYKNMYRQFEALVSMIENDSPAFPTMQNVFSAFKAAMAADYSILHEQVVKLDEFN